MRTVLVGLALAILFGCTGVSRVEWYGKLDQPPHSEDYPIEVFLPKETIGRPYEVLGTAEIHGYDWSTSEQLIRGGQVEARRKGGDAIVLGERGVGVETGTTYVPGETARTTVTSTDMRTGGTVVSTVKQQEPGRVEEVESPYPVLSITVIRFRDASAPAP